MWSSLVIYVVMPLAVGMLIGALGRMWHAHDDVSSEETVPILSEGMLSDDDGNGPFSGDDDDASSRSSTRRGDEEDDLAEEEWVELTEDDATD